MQGMQPRLLSVHHLSTRWVLMAWLCVVLSSVLTPWAKASTAFAGWEPACSATGETRLVPSPVGDDAVVVGHGLDCALCLPLLAPPPAQRGSAALAAVLPSQPVERYAQPWVLASMLPPPPRAPPFINQKL